MHERIRELAEQAGVLVGDFAGAGIYSIHNKEEVEKFAMMLVGECVELVQEDLYSGMGYGSEYSQGADDALEATIDRIKQHFGVRE